MFVLKLSFIQTIIIETYVQCTLYNKCNHEDFFINFFLKINQMIFYVFTSEILKTRVYNQVFGTKYLFVFVWAGREYLIDIVMCIFKISDVQMILIMFIYFFRVHS